MDELTRLAIEAGQGHQAALDGFVRRGQADVWRLCAHLVDRQHADDLTQDTFVRAIGALGRFRADSSARTWLLSIARRTCIDHLRSRGRRQRVLERLGREVNDERDGVPDPAGVVALDELVRSLDDDRRAAFVLTQVLGLGYADAAAVCGCPVGTIRSRVSRARSELAKAAAPRSVEAAGSDSD